MKIFDSYVHTPVRGPLTDSRTTCTRCNANDRLILKLRQEIERLKSRVQTYKKQAEKARAS